MIAAFLFSELDFWVISFALALLVVSLIVQWVKKGWAQMGVSLFALFAMIFVLSLITDYYPSSVSKDYKTKYKQVSEIERIIGVDLPEFDVRRSKKVHERDFDYEFEVINKLKFEEIPGAKIFHKLDSLCVLPRDTMPEASSPYFYYGVERVHRCWTKDGNVYRYERNTDFGKCFLHSKDAYFYFTIKKGEKTAIIRYGNY